MDIMFCIYDRTASSLLAHLSITTGNRTVFSSSIYLVVFVFFFLFTVIKFMV